jgi:hypothetical protein
MRLKEWFTHKIMGKRGIMEEATEIIDGVIVTPDEKGSPVEAEQVEIPQEVEWSFPEEYIEQTANMGVTYKTAKEYSFDLKSFGVCLDTITVEQINNRLRGLAESNKRRKLTALRSYAKWSLRKGNAALFITLSEFKL